MSSYLDNILDKDESVLFKAEISTWCYAAHILLGGLSLLLALITLFAPESGGAVMVMLGVASALLIPFLIAKYCSDLAVTNKRIISKTGLISRKSDEIALSKVESVRIDQDILGRMCNYGTVTVVGTGGSQAPMKGIKDPLALRRVVQSAANV